MGDGSQAFTPSIWFTITPDGKTTMHIVKAEMGQHIGTGLAQIIAEELEVKWDDVRLDTPLESVENFAVYGLAYTVNSGSVTTEFDRLSRAGAAGRIALVEAGAKLLGAKVGDCYAENSRVTDKVSGRSVGYGEIVQKVKIDRKFAYPEDFKKITLKAFGDYKIVGKSVPALDIPAKTNGQAKYGMDVFLPNMAYGALVVPRTRYGSKVQSIDESDAKKIPGFIKAVRVDESLGKCTGWVVALAETFPAAMKAAKALKVKVDPGPYGKLEPERHHGGVLRAVGQDRGERRLGAGRRRGEGRFRIRQGAGSGVQHGHGLPRHHGADQRHRLPGGRRELARLHRHAEHVLRTHDAERVPVQGAE